MTYEGACHCGSVVVWFETDQNGDAIEVRACQCSFCRRHAAKSVSDPKGWLEVRAAPGALRRYQFATRSADYLLCGECGCYLGAVATIDGRLLGLMNVVGGAIAHLADRAAVARDYSGDTPETRRARRLERWTPAAVVEAAPNA